jgi:hypothetical protein
MKKKYINKITIGLLVCTTYLGGIKIYSMATSIFEYDNVFLNTSLIYINPYATKYHKELYKKSKKEETKIRKEIKKDALARERYYWGEWDYETNSSIHKDKYIEELLLLADVSREFNKIISDMSKQESKDTTENENILNKLKEFKDKTIKLNSINKESIDKYINRLIKVSEEAINSRDIYKLEVMPLIIERFAIEYENILMGYPVNEELINDLNLVGNN